ncbi:MAG: hypothetical protein ACLPWD_00775 [Methanobacterium sp.]
MNKNNNNLVKKIKLSLDKKKGKKYYNQNIFISRDELAYEILEEEYNAKTDIQKNKKLTME